MPDSTSITQAHLRSAVKDIVGHFNVSQTKQTEHFDEKIAEIHVELDAIKDMLALKKDVERLERSLLRKGVLTEADLQKAG